MVITTAIRMAVTVKAVVTVRMAVTDRTITARVIIIRTADIIKTTIIRTSQVHIQTILDIMTEGYGFIRCDNFLPGDNDVYVSHALIKKYRLRTGDILKGNLKVRSQSEKFAALLYVVTVNGYPVEDLLARPKFEQLTPIFPNEKIRL